MDTYRIVNNSSIDLAIKNGEEISCSLNAYDYIEVLIEVLNKETLFNEGYCIAKAIIKNVLTPKGKRITLDLGEDTYGEQESMSWQYTLVLILIILEFGVQDYAAAFFSNVDIYKNGVLTFSKEDNAQVAFEHRANVVDEVLTGYLQNIENFSAPIDTESINGNVTSPIFSVKNPT